MVENQWMALPEHPIPLDCRVLVYVTNTDSPGIYTDTFYREGKSDHCQVVGATYYLHNISHWMIPSPPA